MMRSALIVATAIFLASAGFFVDGQRTIDAVSTCRPGPKEQPLTRDSEGAEVRDRIELAGWKDFPDVYLTVSPVSHGVITVYVTRTDPEITDVLGTGGPYRIRFQIVKYSYAALYALAGHIERDRDVLAADGVAMGIRDPDPSADEVVVAPRTPNACGTISVVMPPAIVAWDQSRFDARYGRGRVLVSSFSQPDPVDQ